MKWIKYLIGTIGTLFVVCFFQGCSRMKSINGSTSYYLKGDKIIYSYKGSKYVMGENEVEGVDFKSFIPINSYFAKDKNSVYWHSSKIEKADPQTFDFLPDTKYKHSFSDYYTKDTNHFFYKSKILKNVDFSTFIVHGYNASDKNHLYCKGKVFDKKETSICP